MPESFPNQSESMSNQESREERLRLALELISSQDLPFSGVEESVYKNMKEEEELYPGFCTPIDELIERFKKEGMKVVVVDEYGKGSNSIFVVPAGGPDSIEDRLSPRSLELTDNMDENLKMLITLDRKD